MAPITTHVLDQTRGGPASGIDISLHLLDNSHGVVQSWSNAANTDGRVTEWNANGNAPAVAEAMNKDTAQTWSLRFETGKYWKTQNLQSLYPFVEITFLVDPNDPKGHWHVPILLGQYGYTTYRGS
jgi:5-hydroxyisourate hydrolase